ncbi:alpha/beta-hydrolase [Laetiporus sulphureus 93-53]|uniref:triacylglycerol lipase n=1 Tax=Laetiporus sulphureus 93-53 TaxID=1314785 RepID=A0A165FZV9_9APHY|nr:alpha/beta-hydrolase [Laetiporus sulphureus 93-53]KZT09639.1 alpha/beta-hydrolase [Laetiporus sulphureus 93-53]
MRMLTFIVILQVTTHLALAALIIPSTEISFTPQQEYTLPQDYALDGPQSVFAVSSPDDAPTPTFTLKARPTTIWRPRSAEVYQRARAGLGSEEVEWEQVEVMGPYVEDKHTLTQLARMTGNAYALPGQKNWYEIDPTWNHSFPFGWEDVADGFRGHVFASISNSTVILAIKGTTLQGPTSKKDKFNDNLLFSCCCARVDFSWVFSTVCGCYANHWRCDNGCLSKALIEESLFYNVGVDLINNLTALYPTSTIWLVGHSLGGSLASLLGTTFGLPAVTFESPGERLAAQRLRLPLPPSAQSNATAAFGASPVTHVYHNADPIPQGTCTGVKSLCAQAGYALETRCHLGKTIVFDTVGKLGWRVDVRTHTIKEVITKVLEAQVEGGWDTSDDGVALDVPIAREEVDCVDCYKWEFGDFKDHSACGV